MAEHKYELWTKPPSTKLPKNFPWYAERLKQKYISNRPSGSLIAQDWVFVKNGGDDYRTGLPREIQSAQSYLTYKNGKRHPAQIPRHLPALEKKSKSTMTKEDKLLNLYTMAYSKKVLRKEKQIDNIQMIEKSLTDHPLAVFPHYENALPPEVFSEVIESLDPVLHPASDNGSSFSESDELNEEEEENSMSIPYIAEDPDTQQALSSRGDDDEDDDDDSNIGPNRSFQWYPNDDITNDNKSVTGAQEHSTTDTKIQRVTNDFCEWARGLGGESVPNIEESTIFSLFASGYETKPALSVPIHVVQLSEVPFDLRNGAVNTTDLPSLLQYGVKNLTIKRGDTPSSGLSGARSNATRSNYGAWYLPVNLWQHKTAQGGLNDPENTNLKTVSDEKLKSRELDSTLHSMHGAMSFSDFIERKKARRPDFLRSVPVERNGLEHHNPET